MSFPRYPSYKDSGVEWLGEIPSSWTVQPLKYSTHIYTGNSLNDAEKELYESTDPDCLPYISSKDIDLATHHVQYENGLRIPKEQDELKIAPKGSFLLCIEGGSAGKKVATLNHDVCFVNKLCCFSSETNSRFKYYFAQTQNFKDKFELSMTGLIGGVSTSLLKQFSIPTPSNHEQTAIVNFLDRETAKIDELVAQQQRLMELLKEKRQAVISHAVTQGLNPSAPMKPSGIEWLGDVPAHWEVVSLKHLVSRPIIDGPHETPIKRDEGIPFVSAESVSQGFIDFNKIWGYISPNDHAQYSKRYKPKRGDILIVKLGATTGTPAIVETDDDFSIWVPLAAIRLKTDIDPRFVLHVLRSDNLKIAYELNWTYGTQQTLGLRTISNLRIPIPPKEERQEIVKYLDSMFPLFEVLTVEAQRAIDLLQERRTALISAAVTGQIDVRHLSERQAA